MKKSLLTSALVAAFGVAALAPLAASASDGTITINGAITAASCSISVNGGGTGNATITLPTMQTSSFTGAGSAAGWTAIQIALSGCNANGASVTKVSPYFEQGPNVDASTGYLKPGTGTATGVEVVLSTTNALSGKVNLNASAGTQYSGTAPALTSNPTFTYYAAYVQPSATAVGAGSVATSVQYDLNYQ